MCEFERPGCGILLLVTALTITGCGGSGIPSMVPISVSLSSSSVTVARGGMATQVQIAIRSSSETALVSFVGLPVGVKVTYAASDTNPSGLLTFTATTAASTGTYMPTVTVNSAGQTASLQFTLIVSASTPP